MYLVPPSHLVMCLSTGQDSENPPIYQVRILCVSVLCSNLLSTSCSLHCHYCCVQARGVVTLKLGSIKAPHHEMSGLVLSMDWLPEKPHNIMAIGFYDGMN